MEKSFVIDTLILTELGGGSFVYAQLLHSLVTIAKYFRPSW